MRTCAHARPRSRALAGGRAPQATWMTQATRMGPLQTATTPCSPSSPTSERMAVVAMMRMRVWVSVWREGQNHLCHCTADPPTC
eukprot:scaffold89298_cov22-Tisochrysis_lutea.AAC.1